MFLNDLRGGYKHRPFFIKNDMSTKEKTFILNKFWEQWPGLILTAINYKHATAPPHPVLIFPVILSGVGYDKVYYNCQAKRFVKIEVCISDTAKNWVTEVIYLE